MAGVPPYVTVMVAAPGSPEGQAVLTAYFRDIVSRHHRRPATGDEVSAAMSDEPSDDLRPPYGLFFLARRDAAVVGCVGLRLLPGGLGEITRMFVVPEARRHGVGRQLLQAAEDAALGFGVTRLRLDTSSHLAETRQLYASHGYHEVTPYNDGRHTDRWYQKSLPGEGLRDQTEDVGAAYVAAGLATVWLALGVLTAAGARHRGQRWPRALLSGLLFPVTWVAWYLVDRRPAGG